MKTAFATLVTLVASGTAFAANKAPVYDLNTSTSDQELVIMEDYESSIVFSLHAKTTEKDVDLWEEVATKNSDGSYAFEKDGCSIRFDFKKKNVRITATEKCEDTFSKGLEMSGTYFMRPTFPAGYLNQVAEGKRGELLLEPTGNGRILLVSGLVAGGPTGHTGVLSQEIVTISNGVVRMQRGECTMLFSSLPDAAGVPHVGVRVREIGSCSEFHGMRVNFEGSYVKMEDEETYNLLSCHENGESLNFSILGSKTAFGNVPFTTQPSSFVNGSHGQISSAVRDSAPFGEFRYVFGVQGETVTTTASEKRVTEIQYMGSSRRPIGNVTLIHRGSDGHREVLKTIGNCKLSNMGLLEKLLAE